MLNRLAIEHFATVESLEIHFGPGLTVLTGETGAGKSILFDALDLLFGARADSGVVRPGAARCQLEAEVHLRADSEALTWLREHELDDPDDAQHLLLRRTLRADGGSRAWINGQQCTLSSLRELAEQVLDIHGQHAHQALLRGTEQRRIVDEFGELDDLLGTLRTAHAQWKDAGQQLAALDSAGLNDPAQRELLSYQAEELAEFAPAAHEYAELNAEFLRLNRIDELRADAAWLESLLGDDDAIEDQLSEAQRRCERLRDAQPELSSACEALGQARTAVMEARRDIQHAAESLENDPERLAVVSLRLDQWEALARKHKVPGDALAAEAERLQQVLAAAAGDDARRQALLTAREECLAIYRDAAAALSAARQQAAEQLATVVMAELPALGLPHARMQITVEPEADAAPSRDGMDRVQILVSLNPGQPLAPLAKVASGGELARISLAIAVNTQMARSVPILLFDEVDVGVGGGIAAAIGDHLRQLAEHNQVLCVTHQPQVAALGAQHLRVHKQVDGERTFSRLEILDREARITELSRMAGGREITAQTRAHAQSLLDAAPRQAATAAD